MGKERFKFGKNWKEFLNNLTDERIKEAEKSLCEWLGVENLQRKSFLDIGSGSGLFSLAARNLGATVFSFDYDENSVACTEYLKERFYPNDEKWTVERGDILNPEYLSQFNKYDIVYSWGVLHHTGNLYQALENADSLVADNGTLFISIYNDQGRASKMWRMVKKTYNCTPKILHGFVIDWVGGYPFEVAKPEEIFDFYYQRHYTLKKLYTAGGGHACNQYVFKKA